MVTKLIGAGTVFRTTILGTKICGLKKWGRIDQQSRLITILRLRPRVYVRVRAATGNYNLEVLIIAYLRNTK